jgi:lipopolysaccharide transport system ATP-binding protein
MSVVDVRFEGVSKQYRLGVKRSSSLFWALKDVSFEVERGSSFGIIGSNGAGKSTLLKLLAGITAPTTGQITIVGRLAALIEVGSGFHPELTGRENVFLSGAILGMRRREIAAKLDAIIDFAGVRGFEDTPVKWYSSGMYVRLGFAVAAHLEPDVLLVDEVLAVGDAEFQLKCLERIRALKRQGVTIVFISHDLTAVEQLCDTALLLEHGKNVALGPPADVVGVYHRRLATGQRDGAAARDEHAVVQVTGLTFEQPDATRLACESGQPITIRLRFAARDQVRPVHLEVAFYSADGQVVLAALHAGNDGIGIAIAPPAGAIEFYCPALPLSPGAYYVGAILRDAQTSQVYDWWDGSTLLHVVAAKSNQPVLLRHTWRVVQSAESALPSTAAR